jgi:hypothetical protein
MSFRWNNVVKDFKMPIDLIVTDHIAGNQEKIRIYPTQKWKSKKLKGSIDIDNNYYVDSKYIIQ